MTKCRTYLVSAAALAAIVFSAGSAAADPATCRRAINSNLGKFVQAKLKLLQKCEDAVVRGKIPGPCPDVATATKITRAAGKIRRAVSQRCGGLDRNCGLGGDDEEPGVTTRGAQPAEQGRPAAPGQGCIGDDEVEVEDGRGLQRLGGAGGLVDQPAGELEETGDAAAGEGVGVDDEGGQHRKLPVRADSFVHP